MNGYMSIESPHYMGPTPRTYGYAKLGSKYVHLYYRAEQGPPHPQDTPLPPGLVCSARLP